jgi:Flp pilus assembly pilin Flp
LLTIDFKATYQINYMIYDNIFRRGRALQNKRGQTLAEYALVLALISVVAIGVLMSMGGQVKGTITGVNEQLSISANGGPIAAAPPRP